MLCSGFVAKIQLAHVEDDYYISDSHGGHTSESSLRRGQLFTESLESDRIAVDQTVRMTKAVLLRAGRFFLLMEVKELTSSRVVEGQMMSLMIKTQKL